MKLFHTGYLEIREPDIHHGRKNADFGQGFYLTDEEEFAGRWARERKGSDTIVNTYELVTEGLHIHYFERDIAWFDYIFNNRAGGRDTLPEADVIIGPIANDTIYDTFGIFSSGLLSREESLRMLLAGPAFRQITLKTEKAAAQLTWLSSRILTTEEIRHFRQMVLEEQAAYQRQLASRL